MNNFLKCNDTRPCFARQKNGKCSILVGGEMQLKINDETPAMAELFGLDPEKGMCARVPLKEYRDKECPFRKACIFDVVVGGKTKRKYDGPCGGCVHKINGCENGGVTK